MNYLRPPSERVGPGASLLFISAALPPPLVLLLVALLLFLPHAGAQHQPQHHLWGSAGCGWAGDRLAAAGPEWQLLHWRACGVMRVACARTCVCVCGRGRERERKRRRRGECVWVWAWPREGWVQGVKGIGARLDDDEVNVARAQQQQHQEAAAVAPAAAGEAAGTAAPAACPHVPRSSPPVLWLSLPCHS